MIWIEHFFGINIFERLHTARRPLGAPVKQNQFQWVIFYLKISIMYQIFDRHAQYVNSCSNLVWNADVFSFFEQESQDHWGR